jgi:hypothetical protein
MPRLNIPEKPGHFLKEALGTLATYAFWKGAEVSHLRRG